MELRAKEEAEKAAAEAATKGGKKSKMAPPKPGNMSVTSDPEADAAPKEEDDDE